MKLHGYGANPLTAVAAGFFPPAAVHAGTGLVVYYKQVAATAYAGIAE